MELPPLEPESSASTNSAIPAYQNCIRTNAARVIYLVILSQGELFVNRFAAAFLMINVSAAVGQLEF